MLGVKPDHESSDPANEGRRIEKFPGGWMVLNAPKYRQIVTRLVAKEGNRRRVAKHREKKAEAKSKRPKIDKKGRTWGFNQPAPIHAFDCECAECEALNAKDKGEAA